MCIGRAHVWVHAWSTTHRYCEYALSIFAHLYGIYHVSVSRSVVSNSLWPHGVHIVSPPGSSVPGILQARILECVAIPIAKISSWPRDRTWSPALQASSLPSEPPGMWSVWNLAHIKHPLNVGCFFIINRPNYTCQQVHVGGPTL